MTRQPGGDKWARVLAHRPEDRQAQIVERFVRHGIEADAVAAALDDLGTALCVAASSGADDWAAPFGGELAVALLAAEVGAFAAHLNSRASAVRARAVDALLEDFSAVTVAAHLGVSRQKVYEIGRPPSSFPCIDPIRGGQ